MPRSNRGAMGGGLIHHHHGSCKIRKRGCSLSASSSSSTVHHYRLKRTILVGGGTGKARTLSRSITPVPAWRTTPSLLRAAAIESPNSRPVSARKLAAILWEMNEMPSPRKALEKRLHKGKKSAHQDSVPSHLADQFRCPISERMELSGTHSQQRWTSPTSQNLGSADYNPGALDTFSSASLMEIETRSRAQTPRGSIIGVRNRLKDVSNALTTSKELLKIINRVWANADPPSSSMSLVSALHAELERARLQVNQLIQEKRSDQTEINYLIKCFAEEKASWKNKVQKAVEAAIESIAGELEVEKKLRRRFESLNKKLGKELAETKTSFLKAIKEVDREKRAREIVEQLCDELARDIGEERAEVEELKRESSKVHEEVEKEREMLKLTDILREERVQMKLSEAKLQFEEKNVALDKLRKQLEASLKNKVGKMKGCGYLNLGNNKELVSYLSKTHFGSHLDEEKEDDAGEVEDAVDCEEDLADSELHSIELKMDNNNKSYKWAYKDAADRDHRRVSVDDELQRENSTLGILPRKSNYLQRSISGGVACGLQTRNLQHSGDGLHPNSFNEVEEQSQRKIYDEIEKYKLPKGVRDRSSSSPRLSIRDFDSSPRVSIRDFASPNRQWGQSWSSLGPGDIHQERPIMLQGSGLKSRLADVNGERSPARRSRW